MARMLWCRCSATSLPTAQQSSRWPSWRYPRKPVPWSVQLSAPPEERGLHIPAPSPPTVTLSQRTLHAETSNLPRDPLCCRDQSSHFGPPSFGSPPIQSVLCRVFCFSVSSCQLDSSSRPQSWLLLHITAVVPCSVLATHLLVLYVVSDADLVPVGAVSVLSLTLAFVGPFQRHRLCA